MSEEAYQEGVRKGMLLERARRLCPAGRVIAPRFDRYEAAMADLLKRAQPYSPLIEAEEGNGHLFLDATGTGRLFGPPQDVAWRIRRAARRDLGLNPIWSLAGNKLLAKVASRVVKPEGEYVVPAGEEEAFLRPLPLRLLPGLEREDLALLRELNVGRVEELLWWGLEQLAAVFGRRGGHLHRLVRGVDASPVRPLGRKEDRVQGEWLFGEDAIDLARVEAALLGLAERLGFELRERGLVARRLGLTLDHSDGVRVARTRSDPLGTASDFKLLVLARSLLDLAWVRRVRLRRLRLVGDRLANPPAQLELFPDEPATDRRERLLPALDEIRRRFGRAMIQAGQARLA
jgi:DNA polymerase-4